MARWRIFRNNLSQTPINSNEFLGRHILLDLLLLAIALAIFQVFSLDLWLQNQLFIHKANGWLIDSSEPIAKFFFYKLPKILYGSVIFTILLLIIFHQNLNKNFSKPFHKEIVANPHFSHISGNRASINSKLRNFCSFDLRRSHKFLPDFCFKKLILMQIFLGLSLTPLIAGNIKKFTNIYCPNQLEIYNGSRPYVKIFDSYPSNFVQEKRGKCFPAGHAVTGFSLYIFCFVQREKRAFLRYFFLASFFGWVLGFYQIAKGAHFLSDTVVAMLVCRILAALIALISQKFLSKKIS